MELLGWVVLSVWPVLPLILLALHLLSQPAGLVRSILSAVLPLYETRHAAGLSGGDHSRGKIVLPIGSDFTGRGPVEPGHKSLSL